MPKQIRSLFTGLAGVGGGTTPEFGQITIPGLLSFTGVTIVSESCPNWQLDETNTISIDGLACCERAARNQEVCRHQMPQIRTKICIAQISPAVKPAPTPPPPLKPSFTI